MLPIFLSMAAQIGIKERATEGLALVQVHYLVTVLGATFPRDLGEQPEEQQHTDEMDWPGPAKHKKS